MDDAREAYWHEGEPRIVASGRWQQDEFGDTTYIPDHVRPSTAAGADAPPVGGDLMDAPAGDSAGDTGYRIRSDAVWTAARRDYLAGDAAEAVCARYDLKLGTLRAAPRARAGAAATSRTSGPIRRTRPKPPRVLAPPRPTWPRWRPRP